MRCDMNRFATCNTARNSTCSHEWEGKDGTHDGDSSRIWSSACRRACWRNEDSALWTRVSRGGRRCWSCIPAVTPPALLPSESILCICGGNFFHLLSTTRARQVNKAKTLITRFWTEARNYLVVKFITVIGYRRLSQPQSVKAWHSLSFAYLFLFSCRPSDDSIETRRGKN